MGTIRIAVVEDEPSIAEVICYNLERHGFEVDVFNRGDDAWQSIRGRTPDLVVLDLMLPGIDGLEMARLMKRHPETESVPIVMLTAKGEEVDRIVGFELGADDYVSKPFSARELVLRVKAVLRRMKGAVLEPEEDGDGCRWLEAGGIRLDAGGFRVAVDGEPLALTATEFKLLESLLAARGRTKTRSALLDEVWGYSAEVDSRTVDTHVRRLRKKLAAEADRIETVIGVGYRMRG